MQPFFGILHDAVIALEKLNFHPIEIIQIQHQEFTLFVCHYCELSYKFLLASENFVIVEIVLVLENAAYDVDHSEIVSLVYIYIFGVFVLWKYEARRAIFQKVHPSYLITFKENVFVFSGYERSQDWKNPCNEGR